MATARMFIVQQYRPGPLHTHEINRAFEQGMLEVGKLIGDDFESTVATWEVKPDFQVVTSFKNNRLEVFVYTENQVYAWLNDGTQPHYIEATNAQALAFHEGYTAKTDPGLTQLGDTFVSLMPGVSLSTSAGAVAAHGGGESGGMVFVNNVFHPGIEPRNFAMRIRLKRTGDVERIMQKAVDKAGRVSGHWLGPIHLRGIGPNNIPQPVPFSGFPVPPITPSTPNFLGSYNFVSAIGSSSGLSNLTSGAAFRGLANFITP